MIVYSTYCLPPLRNHHPRPGDLNYRTFALGVPRHSTSIFFSSQIMYLIFIGLVPPLFTILISYHYIVFGPIHYVLIMTLRYSQTNTNFESPLYSCNRNLTFQTPWINKLSVFVFPDIFAVIESDFLGKDGKALHSVLYSLSSVG